MRRIALVRRELGIKVKNPKAPAAIRATLMGRFDIHSGHKFIVPSRPTGARLRRPLGLSTC
jgi:hypothetical protein